jgi:hypothetical protein
MKLSEVFTSNYLKAADLKGKEPTATISRVVYEQVGQEKETRLVMYFDKVKKGMVLNKTNAMTVGVDYGDDTDAWTGRQVTLYTAWVDFQGRSTQAIRLRIPATTAVPSAPAEAPEDFSDLDDDTPF